MLFGIKTIIEWTKVSTTSLAQIDYAFGNIYLVRRYVSTCIQAYTYINGVVIS